MLKGIGIVIGGFMTLGVVAIIGAALWVMSVRNGTISLENQFTASVSKRTMLYDNMGKQIQEKLGVAKIERKTMIAIIDAAVAGRDGGSLFKTVSEQYPATTHAMFQEVMATVGGKRDEFTRSQLDIASIKQAHDNKRMHWPSSLIVGDRKELEYVIVSSDSAKETMKTGSDNNILITE